MEKSKLDVQIRFLVRRDMNQVIEIDKQSFSISWTEEEFLYCPSQRNCIGMVAEQDHRVIGFMCYELHKEYLRLLRFAVDPKYHRQGFGTAMINVLVEKLEYSPRRTKIILEVQETNLSAQLFYKALGFKAKNVLRNHYFEDDIFEDAYIMKYSIAKEIDIPLELSQRNLNWA